MARKRRCLLAVQLRRQGDELIVLEAAFEAEFVQSCVVTLEPVVGSLSNSFVLGLGATVDQHEAGRD